MRLLLSLIICIASVSLATAQSTVIEFLDDEFKPMRSAKNAAYIQEASYNDQKQLEGPIKIMFMDSTTYMEGYYFQGKRFGKFIWYWPGGVVKQKGSYSGDKQIGEWFTYLKNGQQDEFNQFDAHGNLTSTYPNEESIFGYVEDWPKWISCEKEKTLEKQKACTEEKRNAYLASIPYPSFKTERKEATVKIYCIIDKAGKATEVHTTLSSGDGDLDVAAVEWVRNMPTHIPGSWHGKTVKVQLNLEIHFKP